MANKMLIDATHPEETRVVVLRGSRVEEFDFESASKRQLRGNIYLAKVIRVEPSLQAAFVDYGGNRHGFLAFSEIHPDYYQIPVSDRQALLEEEAREEPDEEEERRPRRSRRRNGDRQAASAQRNGDSVVSEQAETDGPPDRMVPGGQDAAANDAGDHDTHKAAPGEESSRPVHLDALQTPPYDDPTADLIERASEVHEHGGEPADAPAAMAAGHAVPTHAPEQPGVEPSEVDAGASLSPDAGSPGSGDSPMAATGEAAAGPLAPQDARGGVEAHWDARQTGSEDHDGLHAASDASVDTGSSEAPEGDADGEHEHQPPSSIADDASTARRESDDGDDRDEEDEQVDQIGGDALEEVPRRAYRSRRQYKIQEVIKRRQVLLVQVVKEERGNKGAALTTYLSLAGRYSVLMPNTAKGGGISRKITDAGDRQRLKTIAQDLEVPDGMGVILRTAGAMRTKPEVKRDFEYLMRMWETVREMTLASSAPTLVYEEGSLIKRAIRDLYNKDVEEIVVDGEGGFREAKDFMRLLMPSHAKNVQPWRDPAPLFTKAGAEAQLDAMFSSQVTLKSGGYLVINQTEALVAIDVNSGRSTREHNIEDTALRTNLEASDEVARQLRLRDLAGLIVVDFIDMEESRNNRAVERRLKDALKDDRARIQIGRISHFGLLEMSRQRMRTGVLEGSTEICQQCAGAGMVRSTSSIALHVLRLLEDTLVSDASRNLTVRTRGTVALYILNHKRAHLTALEGRFGVAIAFESDEHLTGTSYCNVERGEPASGIVQPIRPMPLLEEPEDIAVDEPMGSMAGEAPEPLPDGAAADEENGDGRRRRRRRRGRGRDRESSGITEDAPQPSDDALGFASAIEGGTVAQILEPTDESAGGEHGEDAPLDGERSRRRRSRRGGRRTRDVRGRVEGGEQGEAGDRLEGDEFAPYDHAQSGASPVTGQAVEPEASDQYLAVKTIDGEARSSEPASDDQPIIEVPVTAPPAAETATPSSPLPDPVHAPVAASVVTQRSALSETPAGTDTPGEDGGGDSAPMPRRPEPVSSELDPSRPKRSGWWQKAKATLGG